MTILILEDRYRRWDWFRKHYSNYDIIIVDHYEAAIDYLKHHTPHIIFLDHDLDGKWFSRKSDNTGMKVAEYIANSGIYYNKVIIHSMNILRNRKMYRLCKKGSRHTYKAPLLTLRRRIRKEYL